MNKNGLYFLTFCVLIIIGFALWVDTVALCHEQDKRQNCEQHNGVYVSQYRSQGVCLQIVDGKLKEI